MQNIDSCPEKLVLLFVDDDISVLSAYRRMLRLSQFECLFMTDKEFNVENAFVHKVDIAFFDQNMPHVNGVELLHRLEQVNPLARRVLMSGDFSRTAISQNNSEIYHALLPKPCSKEMLLQCVASLRNLSS
jgi:response regulator RpfG family c-di-GMP phosphodiesterase